MIKKNTKVRFFVSFFLIFCIRIHAQTNVSGGIYNSTTWHKINSPYIVTDTIVVFPGVTLTIEPGVTVKFDYHTILQIRQAEIIAIGTAADSITFTSNLVNSSVADWNGIFLYGSPPANLTSKFDFCNFYFGDRVLRNQTSLSDSIRVRNSKFVHNNIGIYNSNCLIADTCQFIYNVINGIYNNYGNLYLNNCYVSHSQNAVYGGGGKIVNSIFEFNQTAFDFLKYVILNNCRISNNQYGFSNGLYGCVINSCVIDSNTIVGINATPFDSILNCEIKNNVIGIVTGNSHAIITENVIENNTIGIELGTIQPTIYCNRICNNSTYDLRYTSINNISISNNNWCTSDSSVIASHIYDGYDNINFGLVNFMPIDSLNCYLITEVQNNLIPQAKSNVYPNPVSDYLSVVFINNERSEMFLYDISARKVLQINFINTAKFDTGQLEKGLYIYEIRSKNGICIKGKVMKD